jgi:catechol 2,3-dioxygenase-like lactoylglutathione lyase family enzyme
MIASSQMAGVEMGIRGISHVAVGVSDMERALVFYRDVIGLRVRADQAEEMPAMGGGPPLKRRGVYLCWSEGPHESFLVLDEQQEQFGEPARLFQRGIHHFSFWVDDADAIAARAGEAGFEVVVRPSIGDTWTYGEAPGGKVKSAFLRDADGNNVQIDQRM